MGVFELLFKSAHGRSKEFATPGDPYVPLFPCRLSHGIKTCLLCGYLGRRVGLLTAIQAARNTRPLLPCRLSHGIRAVCYVRTLVTVYAFSRQSS